MATSSPTLHESPSVEVDPIDPDGDGPPYPAPRNPVDIDAPGEHESADKSAPDEEDAPRSTSSDSGASPPLPEGTSRASSLKRASSLRHTNDGILQNTDFEPPLKTKVLAVAVPLTICVFCNLVYMGVSGVAQRTYLRFVEEHPRLWADNRRLPDLVLDLFENNGWHDSYSSMNFWTGVSDTFPLLILGLCTFYLVVYQHFVVINRCLLTQSFLISLNALAENLTILPSSYGYERCLDYLGINSSADLPGFSFSPTGTCSAMIWSGHCVHTLIAGHMLGCAIAEDHPEGVPWVPARVCRVVRAGPGAAGSGRGKFFFPHTVG